MTQDSPRVMVEGEQPFQAGIQTALILALVGGEELRVLDASEREVVLESVDPLPDQLELTLALFQVPRWRYREITFGRCAVVERRRLDYSEVCRVALGTASVGSAEDYAEDLARLRTMWQGGPYRDGSMPAGIGDLPSYRAIPVSQSHETLRQQRRAWFAGAARDETRPLFAEIAGTVEHAFAVSTPAGYDLVLKLGSRAAVGRVLSDLGLAEHGLFSSPFARLYVGNEFCPHLSPDGEQLLALLDAGLQDGLAVTVTTPLLMEHTLDHMDGLLARLEQWSRRTNAAIEVVINDFGLLEMLSEVAPGLTPVLGVLLNKRKKDPRAGWAWGVDAHRGDLEQNNLNTDWYRSFLAGVGVRRFELEAGPMGQRVPGRGHSLRYPTYFTNASAFCMLHAELTEFYGAKQRLVRSCPRYCSDFCAIYPDHLKLVGRGNVVLGFDDQILVDPARLMSAVEEGVDRLVFMADALGLENG